MKKLLLGLGLVLLLAPASAWANCNATSAAPALQQGTQPCSMDLSGNLRVLAGSGSTGGTAANPQFVSPGTGAIFSQQPVPGSGSTVGITPTVTATSAGSLVLRAGAGQLYQAYVNNGAVAGYLLIFNSTTVPADGTVAPLACITAPASTTTYFQPPYPMFMSTGMTLVFSSTGCFTKTIGTGDYLSGTIK